MNLVRWSPFGEINRLFDSALPAWPTELTNGAISWNPAADIYETDNELVVYVDLPGIDPKMVDARVANNILTIRGERRVEKKYETETFHRIERSHGGFARSFTLATAVEAGKIRATYKAGVLTLTLPKAETAKPKRIEIAGAAAA